jgi:hypothetical protein
MDARQILDDLCQRVKLGEPSAVSISRRRTSPACREFMRVFWNPTRSHDEVLSAWKKFVAAMPEEAQ